VTGAPGNQPTKGLIRYFRSLGIETGINEQKLLLLAKMLQTELYSNIQLNRASSQQSAGRENMG